MYIIKKGGVFLKKEYMIILFAFIIFLSTAHYVDARSFSIDRVHIKAWIEPNGDVLINEVFNYSFSGQYKKIQRSIQTDGHDGVEFFEAHLLQNHNAEPGFIGKDQLQPLNVDLEGNTYNAELPSNDEKITVFFLYKLKNAVRSYDTYSDLTIPFFGMGSNHSEDLHNVTIDFVFPQAMQNYYPFLHGADGEITGQTEEVVRFFIPLSAKRQYTEARLLYPSNIMIAQSKQPAPMSLQQALKEEQQLQQMKLEDAQFLLKMAHFIFIIAILCLSAAFLLRLIPQRIARSTPFDDTILMHDPLQLYMIDRVGQKDNYAFFAGILALVRKGLVTISETTTPVRFAHDEDAPAKTLKFTLKKGDTTLSSSEMTLVDWLFTRKVKGGSRIFSISNIYGATLQEKKEKKEMHGHYIRRSRFMQKEQIWYTDVVKEMKEAGIMSNSISKLISKIILAIVLISIIFASFAETLSGLALTFYIISAVYCLRKGNVTYNRKPMYLFFAISFIISYFFIDSPLRLSYSFFILASALLFTALPPFFLSKEAIKIRRHINAFKKVAPFPISSVITLDEQLALALLLKTEKIAIHKDKIDETPLATFILTNGDPFDYLLTTWKLSNPPFAFMSSDKSSSSSYSDGGGYSGGGGGSGDGGGGAGAD